MSDVRQPSATLDPQGRTSPEPQYVLQDPQGRTNLGPQDVLQQLAAEDVPRLLQVLQQDLPDSALIFNWIKNMSAWNEKIPGMSAKILCPRGDWRNGTVIGLCSGLAAEGKVFGALYTREEDCAELRDALETSAQIPWDRTAHFTGVLEKHVEALRPLFVARGFSFEECLLHYLPAEEAAQVPAPQPPAGVEVRRLDESHVDVVCRTWPPFVECLRPVVRAVVTHNRTAGVFVGGTLASMALQTYHGGVGALQTVPEFRGRGLAPLALAALVRDMGQGGVGPQLRVNTDNHVALKVVRKVGFKVIGTSYTVTNVANL